MDLDSLDEIASGSDLTLVATGKGGLASLFPLDAERTVYTEPQRQLLMVTLQGPDHSDETWGYRSAGGTHSVFNLHADFGEAWIGPYLHKDVGPSWSFRGFAKPDSPWVERFDTATDAHSARQAVVDLYREYFPKDAVEVEQLRVIEQDPHSWLRGAVTPTVRRGVGRTAGGHVVAAIGDTAISFDPVAGQGAQNTVVQVAALVAAVRDHVGDFTEQWLSAQFEKHWEARGHGAAETTRLFSNGKDYDGITAQIDELREVARAHKREVKVGLNGFIIARDTEKEARETLREIVAKANRPAVEGFRNAVKQAGSSTGDGKGMWADSSFEDLVQYNDGFARS